MNEDDPQSCTKCGCTPQDILMLSCTHDLCLNCASDRLVFEMRKNKNVNAIVCEECHEKTTLDSDSVDVLKSLIKPVGGQSRNHDFDYSKNEDFNSDSRIEKASRNQPLQKYAYDKGNMAIERGEHGVGNNNNNINSKVSIPDVFQGISSKKNCSEHIDEEILYFCFQCKCQCICPECVIHGKHKGHDVKTIRKSMPLIKIEMDKFQQRIDCNTEILLIKKSEIEKQIRSLSEQNSVSKRQIQQTFEQLKTKLAQTEKQVLLKCDESLTNCLSDLEKTSKQIIKKLDELKSYSATISQSTRKQQILLLNFYSRKHDELQQNSKEPQIIIPSIQLPNSQPVMASIIDISDQVERIFFIHSSKNLK